MGDGGGGERSKRCGLGGGIGRGKKCTTRRTRAQRSVCRSGNRAATETEWFWFCSAARASGCHEFPPRRRGGFRWRRLPRLRPWRDYGWPEWGRVGPGERGVGGSLEDGGWQRQRRRRWRRRRGRATWSPMIGSGSNGSWQWKGARIANIAAWEPSTLEFWAFRNKPNLST